VEVGFGLLLKFMADGRPIVAAMRVGRNRPQTTAFGVLQSEDGFNILIYTEEIGTEIVAGGTEVVCNHPRNGCDCACFSG